ncbi:CAP domain-containing protein [Oceanobacillus senegalensis]|uniref:CAP domain-containing protein n=1 Tax=Oceanobacillus senegalensis TaxID=1936063 RepID=UPI001FE72641|nr:CAP domain-containing protein [Oceanobacillus senegalensis]
MDYINVEKGNRMMRFIRSIVILTVIALSIFYFTEQQNFMANEEELIQVNRSLKEKSNLLEIKSVPVISEEIDLFECIGQSNELLLERLGEPLRKDPSAYKYEWWIYKQSKGYLQFGILNNEIVTVFGTGMEMNGKPLQIGQMYDELDEEFSFEDEVTYREGLSSYTFRLTKEDLMMRPLMKVSENVFAQLYFDTITKKLSSIRVLSADILLMHRPYEIVYRGDLPQKPDLTESEWKNVEKGMEQQVFDLTNVIRKRHNIPILEWEETVSGVAFNHSKDMAKNNYFSHYKLNGDGLKERLATKDVFYVSAGENIAAQYTDAPAAIEGWLNSESHREALLNKEYTHLGVGVYRLYYTQNFLEQPY